MIGIYQLVWQNNGYVLQLMEKRDCGIYLHFVAAENAYCFFCCFSFTQKDQQRKRWICVIWHWGELEKQRSKRQALRCSTKIVLVSIFLSRRLILFSYDLNCKWIWWLLDADFFLLEMYKVSLERHNFSQNASRRHDEWQLANFISPLTPIQSCSGKCRV